MIRACEYLQLDVIKLLLRNQKVEINAMNSRGNNAIMHLFYLNLSTQTSVNFKKENIQTHDDLAVEILQEICEARPGVVEGVFTSCDADKDTALIQAARANLPKSIQFLCEKFHNQSIDFLEKQLLHTNKKGESFITLGTSSLIEEVLQNIPPIKKVSLLMKAALQTSSTTSGDKEKLLSLIKECFIEIESYKTDVHKLIDQYELDKLAAIIFQKETISNDINIELAELLYTGGNLNLQRYEAFVHTLTTEKREDNNTIPKEVVISEDNKQKLLEIINVSNILCTLSQATVRLNKDTPLVLLKDYALKRFCFLIATNSSNDLIAKSTFSSASYLLNLAKNTESPKGCKYNFDKAFTECLTTECGSIERFNAVLQQYGTKLMLRLGEKSQLINNLKNLESIFGEKIYQLFDEITKILNPNILSIVRFERFCDGYVKLTSVTLEGLKFFKSRGAKIMPDKLNQVIHELHKESTEYYIELGTLDPALGLIRIALNGTKIRTIKEFWNELRVQETKTVKDNLETVKLYLPLFDKLEKSSLLDKASLQASFKINLPIIKENISEEFTQEANLQKLIVLCQFIGNFLPGINPITNVLIEEKENYEKLHQEIADCMVIGESYLGVS